MSIFINGEEIEQVKYTKFLGLYIDKEFIQLQYDHDYHLVQWSFPGKHKREL